MRIERLVLHRVRIPLRRPFRHAGATRREAENVVVHCRTATGIDGWGETIARDYVTGETTEGVIARCREVPTATWEREIHSAGDVDALLSEAGMAEAHAARCGVETALLDALARERGLPLAALLARDLPELARVESAGPFRYSGPLGLASPAKTVVRAAMLRAFGFRGVKLKLGDSPEDDARRVRLARRVLGRGIELRVDANAAWDFDRALHAGALLARAGISSLEQPLAKDELARSLELRDRLGIDLVLDESLCGEADARAALAGGAHRLAFSVKLAKMGGFLGSLRVLRLAHEHGVAVQLSCQVGESAILSAAGRQLAVLCPNLRWLEGSFDHHLLSDNVTRDDVTFGRGGLAPALTGAGLGIRVDPEAVRRLAVATHLLVDR